MTTPQFGNDVAPKAEGSELCSWEGCGKPARSKGLCSMHYSRKRDGRPMDAPAGTRTRTQGEPVRKRISRSLAELRDGAAFLISGINAVLLPMVIKDARDLLAPHEIALLADGVAAEAEGNKWIAELLAQADGISPHVALLKAAYIIAIPRLIRHGVIPDVGNPLPVAAGRAPGDNRGYGDGEIDANGASVGTSGLYAYGANEGRPDNVAGAEAFAR